MLQAPYLSILLPSPCSQVRDPQGTLLLLASLVPRYKEDDVSSVSVLVLFLRHHIRVLCALSFNTLCSGVSDCTRFSPEETQDRLS